MNSVGWKRSSKRAMSKFHVQNEYICYIINGTSIPCHTMFYSPLNLLCYLNFLLVTQQPFHISYTYHFVRVIRKRNWAIKIALAYCEITSEPIDLSLILSRKCRWLSHKKNEEETNYNESINKKNQDEIWNYAAIYGLWRVNAPTKYRVAPSLYLNITICMRKNVQQRHNFWLSHCFSEGGGGSGGGGGVDDDKDVNDKCNRRSSCCHFFSSYYFLASRWRKCTVFVFTHNQEDLCSVLTPLNTVISNNQWRLHTRTLIHIFTLFFDFSVFILSLSLSSRSLL